MLLCMRTSFDLDDQLYREMKRLAAESGRSLKEILEDSLRQSLARRKKTPDRRSITLPTFRGDGLQPGVDLDDGASLLDRMEGRAPR
jgi:hypothetical protein